MDGNESMMPAMASQSLGSSSQSLATAADDQDLERLPLEEKLTHKSWKARQMGYEQLQKYLEREDPSEKELRPWIGFFSKMVVDANAVAQEGALAAIQAFLRIATVPMAIQYQRQEEVVKHLGAKQPKTVAGTVAILRAILSSFGGNVVRPKPIFKVLPGMFAHADKNVRAEATQLAIELYRWYGLPVFEPVFKELKPVQVKELKDQFEASGGRSKPERFLRSMSNILTEKAAEDEAAAAQDGPEHEEEEEQVQIDLHDLVEPQDVLSKINDDLYTKMASPQWKERKEGVEDLFKILDVPRYADGSYHQLVSAVAKRVSDINIIVGLTAVQCVQKMAIGLKTQFAAYRGSILPTMLEKCKEKKPTFQAALREALDAIFLTLPGLPDVIPDFLEHVRSKNPQVRQETVAWFTRCMTKCKAVPNKADIKTLADTLTRVIEDPVNEIREVAMESLGTLLKLCGERAVKTHLEKVDPIKMAKVQDYCGKAKVKAKAAAVPAGNGPVVSAAPTPATSRPATGGLARKPSSAAPKKSAASSRPGSTPGSAAVVRKSSVRPSSSESKVKAPGLTKMGSAASSRSDLSVSVQFKFSDSALEDHALDYLNEDQWKQLDDSAWKVRLEAMDYLLESIKNRPDGDANLEPEILLRLLRKRIVWKDNNFQVSTRLFQLVHALAKKVIVHPATAAMVVPTLAEKLGDVKLKPPAAEALTALAEACTLDFVLARMYEPVKTMKSPKATSEGIKAIREMVMEFGIDGLALRDLIDFARAQLAEANPMVRTAAVQLIGTLRVFIGPDIKNFLKDVPPAQMSVIDAEFEKVAVEEKPEIKRKQNFAEEVAPSRGSSMEDLFPRVDISGQITASLVQNVNNANWKVRKEGLEQIVAILEAANKRIKPTTGDLLPALKARLSDSNKNLTIMALELSATVAVAIGPPFEKCIRIMLPGVLNNLNDNKVQVRAAALTTLDAFHTVASLESMLAVIGATLVPDSPNLRKDLLTWLTEHFNGYIPGPKKEITHLISPLLQCLLDRSQEVRKVAQLVLPIVVKYAGYDLVKEKAQDLRGAAAQTVMPLIDGCRTADNSLESIVESVPASTASASKPTSRQSSVSQQREPSASVSRKLTLKKKPSSSASVATSSASKEAADAPLDADPPILTADVRMKEKRSDQDRGLTKWSFDTPRKEIVDFLREQMEPHFNAHLVKILFSEDHHKEKDHMVALTLLDEYLVQPSLATDRFNIDETEFKSRFVANSDLILKYVTIRLFDSNTSMLLKVLDVLDHLFALLDQMGAHLVEYEASAFLPYFLAKLGDGKEVVRSRVRGLNRQLCRIYPASKLFGYLVTALSSKNARTRAECLDEMGGLIQRNGMNVCSPTKSLPLVAAQISDRDSTVRTAAINTIVQVYAIVGENVFRYLGRLPEKERSLLDERIKRSKIVPPPVSPTKQVTRTSIQEEKPGLNVKEKQQMARELGSAPPTSSQQFSLDLDQLNLPQLSNAVSKPTVIPTPVTLTPTKVRPRSTTGAEYAMDVLATQITSGDVYQSIDALKQLEKYIQSNFDAVIREINPLVIAITLQVRLAFTSTGIATTETNVLVRLCRHLVNALIQEFSNPALAVEISRETMHQLLAELLTRLVDQGIHQETESGAQLVRALNVLMLRLLENCDTNNCFSVLLDLLDAGVLPLESPMSPETTPVKYAELVMKCLWKLTKALQQTIRSQKVSVPPLLLDLHKFLTATPPSEWKHRAANKLPLGDMPLRTVKTILHELATALGADVLNQFRSVMEEPKRSPVFSYLQYMLEQAGALPQEASAPASTGQPRSSVPTPTARSLASSPHREVGLTAVMGISMPKALSERESVLALDQIFERISSKEETKQGLLDLYMFIKHQPLHQDKVNVKLATHGVNFRIYIRRGLQKIAEERGETLPEDFMNVSRPISDVTNRPPSTSPNKASVAPSEETENYKERLARLQKMFGQTKIQDKQQENHPSIHAVNDENSEKAARSPVHPPEDPSKGVEALKERLARMKSSMSSSTS